MAVALGTPVRAYTFVLLSLAALFAITTAVAGRYHTEREGLARRHYEEGVALAAAGHRREAIAHLRAVLILRRDDRAAALALSTALLEDGRPAEAGTYLADVLRHDPTSGVANLVRARVARALGDAAGAEASYQRAIYGTWPRDGAARRLDTRFELVELLLGRGERARVLGELEQIKADAPGDVEVARRLGRLFEGAGASDRAADELRLVVAARPGDAEAWAWLCEAEIARGRYAAALAAGERALALRADPATVDRVSLARDVVALDPAAPRLSIRERERRARLVLERAEAALDACVDPREGVVSADLDRDRTAARAVLSARPRRSTDAADTAALLSERLWRAALTVCPDASRRDPALAIVLAGMAGAGEQP